MNDRNGAGVEEKVRVGELYSQRKIRMKKKSCLLGRKEER
jgi:hypothetical protein